MGLAVDQAFQVARVDTEEELLALQVPWTRLLAEIPDAPVTRSWEWYYTWWRHRDADCSLWVLVASDWHGEVAGILPWICFHDRCGPVRISRLAFPGSSFVYRIHQDVVMQPAVASDVMAALVSYLRANRHAWDVIDLHGVCDGAAVIPLLAELGGHLHEGRPNVSPYMALTASWEAYEATHLSANRRQQIRARLRRLERDYPGQVRFERVRSADELERGLSALAHLHQKRWHAKGQHSSFEHGDFAAFQREMASIMFGRDWLRLYLLRVGDEPIAAEHCFRSGDVLLSYEKGFDPEWDRYSPGQLLLTYAIQEAIAEGLAEFDLGPGPYSYKFSFAEAQRTLHHLVVSSSRRGDFWLYSGILWRKLRSMAGNVVPDPVRSRINRLVSSRRRL